MRREMLRLWLDHVKNSGLYLKSNGEALWQEPTQSDFGLEAISDSQQAFRDVY